MPTKRFTGAAAVRRRGVSAGSIDSSSGSASVTPAPRRNVRRGMYFLVANMSDSLMADPRRLDPHLKRSASDDAQHDRREAGVLFGRVLHDRANDRHVVVLDAAAHRLRQ